MHKAQLKELLKIDNKVNEENLKNIKLNLMRLLIATSKDVIKSYHEKKRIEITDDEIEDILCNRLGISNRQLETYKKGYKRRKLPLETVVPLIIIAFDDYTLAHLALIFLNHKLDDSKKMIVIQIIFNELNMSNNNNLNYNDKLDLALEILYENGYEDF